MIPIINKKTCINCGTCAGLAPDVFKMDDEGMMAVVQGVTYEKYTDEVLEAQKACPASAIDVID